MHQLLLNYTQRWRDGRESWVSVHGPVINPREYEVAELKEQATVKAFVKRHHYSRSCSSIRQAIGLYRREQLVGVCVFSQPMSQAVFHILGDAAQDGIELGRFLLLDEVPANGESWFLSRCFSHLPRQIAGIVSFSDPLPRRTADATLVHPGHIGTIYQALNAYYTGRATPRTLRLFPDGTVCSDRSLQKIRKQERGWRYASEQLVQRGAEPLTGDPYPWVAEWLSKLTRKVRTRGNHRYCWAKHQYVRKILEPRHQPYPKQIDPYPDELSL